MRKAFDSTKNPSRSGKLLALPILVETLDIRKRTLGADHSMTMTSMNNLAGVSAHSRCMIEPFQSTRKRLS